ncbi:MULTISPECIES: LysM peptidoglycan-binding domain-containing protein [unclassified Actinomyces]|uniref:LysM peptidoglycan-binding domain-containing protein n=1 Tax=unclassified Actinomyces TaxID=2609248 RepID=UPI000D59B764|nr:MULTISPECIES: LysM peptidoglycan-binding domain-containing protein [unclassified Actinomyces]RAX21182.1 LysM peptidoglycan-binding domain-containing protein [Actinomyces sp. Z3]
MSALAAPVPPRLRLVSAEDHHGSRLFAVGAATDSAARSTEPEGVPAPRPRLRLVTGGVEADPEATSGSPRVAAQPEVMRRPVAPRRRRQSLEELAPTHPAVRSRSRARLGRAASAPQADALQSQAPAPAARSRATSAQVPARTRVVPAPAGRRAVPTAAVQRGEERRPAQQVAAKRSAERAALPVAVRRLLVVGALVLAAVLIVAGGIVASGFSTAPAQTTTATVQSGQSLWDVAVATGAGDVNEVMAQIVDLNGLTSSTLQPGQTLIVPAG